MKYLKENGKCHAIMQIFYVLFCKLCSLNFLPRFSCSYDANNRFCDVCQAGQTPLQTVCELCSNTGGAYKLTDKAGKWVHSLCSIWIPEVFILANKSGISTLTLSSLDKKRYRLKCNLCNNKGACIQCCYGRCATAAHPWCVLNNSQGYTRRVIKNEDGDLVWEIFCKQHAYGVTEPLKPKPKSKMQEIVSHTEVEEEDDDEVLNDRYNSNKNNKRNSGISSNSISSGSGIGMIGNSGVTNSSMSSYNNNYLDALEKLRSLAMSHVFQYNIAAHKEHMQNFKLFSITYGDDNYKVIENASSTVDADEDKGNEIKQEKSKIKGFQANKTKNIQSKAKSKNNDDGGDKEDENDTETEPIANVKKNNKNAVGTSGTTGSSSTVSTAAAGVSFPVLTMSEWPGQTEGEAMDLDHFWNVVSMSFPEDHPPDVSFLTLNLS